MTIIKATVHETNSKLESRNQSEKISYECDPTRVGIGAIACRSHDFQPVVNGAFDYRWHCEYSLGHKNLAQAKGLVVSV